MYISYYINEIIFLVVFENVFDIKNHLFPWTFSRKLRLKQLIGHKFTGLGLEFTGLAHYYRLGSQCCRFAFSVSLQFATCVVAKPVVAYYCIWENCGKNILQCTLMCDLYLIETEKANLQH